MGIFKIYSDNIGKFRFLFKSGRRQIVLISEPYNSKSDCFNRIKTVMKNSTDDAKYERHTSKCGSPYFLLRAANGKVISTSENYVSKLAMENGILTLKKQAIEASIDYLLYVV